MISLPNVPAQDYGGEAKPSHAARVQARAEWCNRSEPSGDGMSEVKRTSLAAFASQLRAWRQHMGWTQVETGEKLGYSASLVSGVETMDKNPTADFAKR